MTRVFTPQHHAIIYQTFAQYSVLACGDVDDLKRPSKPDEVGILDVYS
jgi:hypothetical protein